MTVRNIERKLILLRTFLLWAISEGTHKLAVVKFLVDQSAEVNVRTKRDISLRLWAVCVGDFPVLTFLADKGARLNAKDKNGQTPLIRATQKSKQGAVDFLSQHSAKE